MNQEIEAALDYDAIAEAERLMGGSYKKDDDVVVVGLNLMHRQRQTTNALLHLNRDTNVFDQTRLQWTAIVEDMGFELVLCDDIPVLEDKFSVGDKFRIWWHDGVLLVSDSYMDDKSVNGAKVYLNYRGPWEGMHHCSHSAPIDGPVFTVDRDAREGLRFALEKMKGSGTILPRWERRGFLWLLHYNDTKDPDYDHKAITAERISRLPAHVREAITPA